MKAQAQLALLIVCLALACAGAEHTAAVGRRLKARALVATDTANGVSGTHKLQSGNGILDAVGRRLEARALVDAETPGSTGCLFGCGGGRRKKNKQHRRVEKQPFAHAREMRNSKARALVDAETPSFAPKLFSLMDNPETLQEQENAYIRSQVYPEEHEKAMQKRQESRALVAANLGWSVKTTITQIAAHVDHCKPPKGGPATRFVTAFAHAELKSLRAGFHNIVDHIKRLNRGKENMQNWLKIIAGGTTLICGIIALTGVGAPAALIIATVVSGVCLATSIALEADKVGQTTHEKGIAIAKMAGTFAVSQAASALTGGASNGVVMASQTMQMIHAADGTFDAAKSLIRDNVGKAEAGAEEWDMQNSPKTKRAFELVSQLLENTKHCSDRTFHWNVPS